MKKKTKETAYDAIMRKVGKTIAPSDSSLKRLYDFNKAINKLPEDKRQIIIKHEDGQDMALLDKENHKPKKCVADNSILLLTQGIIELAIADKDETFFMSEYGKTIVDTYNFMLTSHTKHNYNITAELLLEKMRKGTIQIDTEDLRRHII